MQSTHGTPGITRAQANASRSTCTACHQRKVKCDAHDRGYPCTRCCKSGAADDCRLHRKNKRVSRAHRASRVVPNAPLSPATTLRSEVVAQTEADTAAAETIIAASIDVDTGAAAVPTTPGSLFLQTVIANGGPSENQDDDDRPGTAGVVNSTPQYINHSSNTALQVQPLGPDFSASATPTAVSTTVRDNASEAGGSAGSCTGSSSSTSALLHGHGGDGEYKKYLIEFIDQPRIAERPIDKDARILYVGSALSNMHFLLRQRMSAMGRHPSEAESSVTHYPTNRIAKPSAFQAANDSSSGNSNGDGLLPLEAFQLPPKRTVDQLLAAYFAHINPGFPVVDEVLFMRQYRARDPQNPPSLLLLQALLVAGAHALYRSEEPAVRDAHKAAFFRRAKMLLDARFERNRDTLVQAALLLTWHADGPEDVAANAWHWVGVAARTATGLGMHRDAEGSTLVPHNKRMWRRVWWLLFQCDVLVSLQYGRPPALHLDDADVRKLVPSDFQDCGAHTRVDYVIQMTELCMLLATDVLRQQYSRRPTAAVAAAAAAGGISLDEARRAALRRTDEALANWSLHLPPSLQLSNGGNGGGGGGGPMISVWTASLHLTYNTALILLHRPTPAAGEGAKEDVLSSSDDVEICTNAAVAVQQIFQAVCASGQVAYLWSAAINCLFTALIQLSLEVRRSTRSTALTHHSRSSMSAANPLLAVAALRRYDSALASLRQLAAHWPNAQAVVQFFEQSVRLSIAAAGVGADSSATTAAGPVEPPPEASPPAHADVMDAMDPLEPKDHHLPRYAAAAMVDTGTEADAPAPPVDGGPDMTQLLSSLVSASARPPLLPFDNGQPLADPWNDWQRIYWQQPESTDDFLFSF